jgi:protein-tyrosine phosphatase
MIDLHCHLLPGVDDGPDNWEATLEMCNIARNDGVEEIVVTPHANHQYPYSRERHETSLEELRSKFTGIQFVMGCDFHCSYENVQDAIAHPRRYTIGNTRYLLLEFNEFATSRQMTDTMAVLSGAGFRCIITHPERMALASNHDDLASALVNAGGLIQITANSLTGFWGPRIEKVSERLLKAGLVSIIASDGHETKRRLPVLSHAWRIAARMVGEDYANEVVADNPRAILSDREVYADRRN